MKAVRPKSKAASGAATGFIRVGTSRQRLGTRRIPDLKVLRRESRAWNHRMNRDRLKINWKFHRKTARRKFYKRRSLTR